MNKTLREQIADKCIHFSGLMDRSCKKGIVYKEVSDRSSKPYKFPCLKNTSLSGSYCEHCIFPSEERIEKEYNEIMEMLAKQLD